MRVKVDRKLAMFNRNTFLYTDTSIAYAVEDAADVESDYFMVIL